MKRVVYSIVFVIICGCSSQQNKNQSIVQIDLDNAKITNLNSVVDSIQIINLEFNNKSLIGKLKKLIVSDDKFFIHDSQRHAILIFNRDGTYENRIFSRGRGPGEYDRISDFCIDEENDEIIILAWGRKIMHFSFDCKFINSYSVENYTGNNIEYLGNGEAIIYSLSENFRFCFYDLKKNKIIKKVDKGNSFSYESGLGNLYSPFIKQDDGSYYFYDAFSYDILNIKSQLKMSKIHLDFGKYQYDMDNLPLSKGREAVKKKYTDLLKGGNYAINLAYFIETNRFFFTGFTFNKQNQTFISDKHCGNSLLVEDYLFPRVRYYCENMIYTAIEPTQIDLFLPNNVNGLIRNKQFEIESDNPIIVIYKLTLSPI